MNPLLQMKVLCSALAFEIFCERAFVKKIRSSSPSFRVWCKVVGLIVHKYGGSSLGSIERIRHVAEHLIKTKEQGHQLVVVVSAMGQQTNELIALAKSLSPTPPKRELDMLLSVGERISMALVSIALQDQGFGAISLTGSQSGILTDGTHTNARISRVTGERIRQALKEVDFVIVAGFQGVNPATKEITTLGRGGSDLTAVALAQALQADRCEIYTDVFGLCSADPKIVSSAKVIDRISWAAAAELAWSGAKVIHSRAAHLASKYGIAIRKRSSFELNHPGTLIEGEATMESATVKAIVSKNDLSLLEINCDAVAEFMHQLLAMMWSHGVAPSFQNCLRRGSHWTVQVLAPTNLIGDIKKIASTAQTEVIMTDLASISMIGDGFLQNPELVGEALTCLESETSFLTHSNHAIVFAVPQQVADASLQKLHATFLE
jgi:aspartate kinase